jgi:membrane associated rhomboid family serine protease
MIPLRDDIPSRHLPWMTFAVIAVNLGVFLFQLRLGDSQVVELFYRFGIVPARYSHPETGFWLQFPLERYVPFVTSMFLHGGWLHLIGNMWSLWIFGDNVEDRMGRFRFLAFYLLCGLAAGGVHWVSDPQSTIPTVGASGAIAGVMGAYFLLFPRARIITVIPVFFYPLLLEIPAYFFLAYWFAVQVLSGTLALAGPGQVGGVAWWAHGGGFLAGALLSLFFVRRRR